MWNRREVFVVAAIVTLTLAATAGVYIANQNPQTGLVPFRTYAALSDFLGGARSSLSNTRATGGLFSSPATPVAGPATGAPSTGGSPSAPSYSGTNVQVAGVDELDMVKTDGTYLYIASQSEVDILLAYPATSMHVVARIALTNLTAGLMGANASAWATGLFLDGPRLVVFATAYPLYPYGYASPGGPISMASTLKASVGSAPIAYMAERAFVLLFDVSNPAAPVLVRSVSVTGTPSTGRMVNGTVYLVATQWIAEVNGTYAVPQTCVDDACANLSLDRVYHDPESLDSWDYTNLLAVDVATGASSAMSVVTGGYSVLYMSPTAMYLAFFKWAASPVPMSMPFMPARLGSGWTTIYKLSAEALDIEAVASGNVPGSLQSQYAMDEWDGYLRVATTVRDFSETSSTVTNGVYVFDGTMKLVGSVTDLAPGESIFAVRFVEDRAYVVTFRKIDPLFVIDLANPTEPAVSGFLEMPGFSEYLYPQDAAHLIGVGKDAVPAGEGNWSWYQGLKLALYDVTSPTAPTEVANVTLGDRGSDSGALYDPHAFLYIPDRQIVVLPVDLAIVNASQYPDGVPDWAWGTVVWQGVYLFHVNATTGIETLGRISHDNGTVNATCGWYGAPNEIRRSLYIGDVLYTVSGTEVMANSLTDLSEIASVVYAPVPTTGYGCPVLVL